MSVLKYNAILESSKGFHYACDVLCQDILDTIRAKDEALFAKGLAEAAELEQRNRANRLEEDVQRKLGVIDLLNAKLAELRPPEPKFRVGQIVVRRDTGNAYTIHQREFLIGGVWGYSNTRPGYGRLLEWDNEADFRAQTGEERGV
jgi:hypothetical protein